MKKPGTDAAPGSALFNPLSSAEPHWPANLVLCLEVVSFMCSLSNVLELDLEMSMHDGFPPPL